MRTRKWLPIFALAGLCLAVPRVEAADSTWTNTAGGNFTDAGNWSAGIPGAADNAFFTNAASYTLTVSSPVETRGAYFDSPVSNTVTVSMAGQSWLVNTEAVIASDAAATALVSVSAGHLIITNATRSAVLNLGRAGAGRLTLQNARLTADKLVLTNVSDTGNGNGIGDGPTWNTVGGCVSWFLISSCTSTTYGAEILVATNGMPWNQCNLFISSGYGQGGGVAWFIMGGTNSVKLFNQYNRVLVGGNSANNKLWVSGAGSLLLITNRVANEGGMVGGERDVSFRNEVVVTNGARIVQYGPLTFADSSYSNRFVVVGSNSSFYTSSYVYFYCDNTDLVISNGGHFTMNSAFSFHATGTPSNNTVIVTDPGSVFSNGSVMYSQSPGLNNRFIVTNGATAYTSYPYPTAGNSGHVIVTGTGSVFRFGTVYVQDDGQIDSLVATNGGYLINGGHVYIAQTANGTGSCAVAGSGSVWTNTGAVNVCQNTETRANLRVENGGLFTCTDVNMANYDNATGIVTIAGNVSLLQSRGVLNMCTAGAANQAKLRFVADYDGFGTLAVSGAATITSVKSKLEVDLNNLNVESGPREYVLATYASRTGSFDAADITVTGRFGGVVTQTDTNIVVHIYRPPGTLFIGR
ncbi:MAG: hypothetical protein KKD33_03340 [Verrucomicrobia bacterium]|nr:hypothetical protein [Verrucomicrobiota bacterium]